IVSRQLIGARQTEFRGDMNGIQGETLFECCDGLIITPGLRMQLTEKVERVGVAGIQFGDLLESLDGDIRLRERSISNAEVVPGARILWLSARRVQKNVARFIDSLKVQESDALV